MIRLMPSQRSAAWLFVLGLMLSLVGLPTVAQNLGTAPQVNVAVQGQTGAQPEGAFLNFVNWVCNVIAPIGAGVAVLGGIVSYAAGRSFLRYGRGWTGPAGGVRNHPFAGVLDSAGHGLGFVSAYCKTPVVPLVEGGRGVLTVSLHREPQAITLPSLSHTTYWKPPR